MSTSAPWATGDTVVITWSTDDYYDPDLNPLPNVKIELSRDGGSSWETLSSATANDGSYSWGVSGTASTQCKIKISDPNDPLVNWTSTNFEITDSGVSPAFSFFTNLAYSKIYG